MVDLGDSEHAWLDNQDAAESDEADAVSDGTPVSTNQVAGWTLDPVDSLEKGFADQIDRRLVDSQPAVISEQFETRDHCQRNLCDRGFVVDGRLKGSIQWWYFCLPCFSIAASASA